MNSGGGHQAHQKEAHSLQKGGKTKYKRQKTEELGMETCPREGVMKEGKFPNSRKPSHQWTCGEF